MEIPGFSDFLAKVTSQCGLVGEIEFVVLGIACILIAKIKSMWESDRKGLLKIIENQNESVEKLTASLAKVEGMVTVMVGSSKGRE